MGGKKIPNTKNRHRKVKRKSQSRGEEMVGKPEQKEKTLKGLKKKKKGE